MASVLDILGAVFKPLVDVVEHLTISGDAKAALQGALIKGQVDAAAAASAYESQLLDVQSKAILAEANGQGVLQRNWRPVTMLVFLALVVADSFGWLANPLAPQAWSLLRIGIGGYTIGRTVEKIALPVVASVFKK